jgi:L-aspartate oxidase
MLPRRVDVLVIGAGLAGTAAALAAGDRGAAVLVASVEPGSSPRAQGGIAAAVGERDSPELHAADTLAAGAGLCDLAAVRSLTGEAAGVVAWLAGQGVEFDLGPDGRPELALEAAHAHPRVLHAGGDASGAGIMAALDRALSGLPWACPARLEALLREPGGGVSGARLRWQGASWDVVAGATVLATGGYAWLYERSTNAPVSDGAGIWAAYRAGAMLADLEFVQFHPTAFAGPGACFLVTEALRGAGAVLTDLDGHRFLLAIDPRGELAPRSAVARAVCEHLRRTGRSHVLLDARGLGSSALVRQFPGFLARCRQAGVDPVAEPVPVAPAAHYTMGGIVSDLSGRTAVPGLLAAGECARTGVHGANRLASNSLLEAAVFGRRAGEAAAREAAGREPAAAVVVPATPAAPDGTLGMADVRRLLSRAAGPLRDAAGLGEALAALSGRAGATPGAEAARGLARLVCEAALRREESRGGHVRTDFPAESAAWATVQVAGAGG